MRGSFVGSDFVFIIGFSRLWGWGAVGEGLVGSGVRVDFFEFLFFVKGFLCCSIFFFSVVCFFVGRFVVVLTGFGLLVVRALRIVRLCR